MTLATAVAATEGGGGEEKVEDDEGDEAKEEEEEGEYEGHDDAFEEDEKELSWAATRVSLRREALPVIVVRYDWHVVAVDLQSTANG